jgi:hypothetical protein
MGTALGAFILHNVNFVFDPVTGFALKLAGIAVGSRGIGYGSHPACISGGHRGLSSVHFCRNQFEWLDCVAMFLGSCQVNEIDLPRGPVINDVSIRPANRTVVPIKYTAFTVRATFYAGLAIRVVWVWREEIITKVAPDFTDHIVIRWAFKCIQWVSAAVDFFEGTLGRILWVDIMIYR